MRYLPPPPVQQLLPNPKEGAGNLDPSQSVLPIVTWILYSHMTDVSPERSTQEICWSKSSCLLYALLEAGHICSWEILASILLHKKAYLSLVKTEAVDTKGQNTFFLVTYFEPQYSVMPEVSSNSTFSNENQ